MDSQYHWALLQILQFRMCVIRSFRCLLKKKGEVYEGGKNEWKIEGEEKDENSVEKRNRIIEEDVLRKACGALKDLGWFEKGIVVLSSPRRAYKGEEEIRIGHIKDFHLPENPLRGYSPSENRQWLPHPTLILLSDCLNYWRRFPSPNKTPFWQHAPLRKVRAKPFKHPLRHLFCLRTMKGKSLSHHWYEKERQRLRERKEAGRKRRRWQCPICILKQW